MLEDERLLARDLAARGERGDVGREVHERDEGAVLTQASRPVEEEELARLQLAQQRAEALEAVARLLAGGRLEDDGGHAASGRCRRDPASERRVRRGQALDGDALGAEVPGEETRVCRRVRGLEDPEDDRRKEVERGEEPQVLDDGVGRAGHDVPVDRERRELLPRARAKEVQVQPRLGRAARALEEPEDDVLRREVGGRGRLNAGRSGLTAER